MRRSLHLVVAALTVSAVLVFSAKRPAAASLPQATAPTVSRDVAAGTRLFVAYNCGDCHGAGGSGAMGPSLQDNRWRFGGSDTEIYASIAEGRPEGMPAWGPKIPRGQVLQLVAYVRSLGDGKDLTTENFTGATVERAGH